MPNPKYGELVSTLNNLSDLVRGLSDRITALEKPRTLDIPKSEPEAPVVEKPKQVSAPVPSDYKDIIDTILNKHFGLQIFPRSDSPHFELVIVVPKKYSLLTPAQSQMQGADLRVKVISYAEGVNGVRLWAERVLSTFSPEIKGLILADKLEATI